MCQNQAVVCSILQARVECNELMGGAMHKAPGPFLKLQEAPVQHSGELCASYSYGSINILKGWARWTEHHCMHNREVWSLPYKIFKQY